MAAQVPVSGIKIEFYYYSYFYIIFCRKLLPLFVLPKKQRTAGSSPLAGPSCCPKSSGRRPRQLPCLGCLLFLLLLSLSCGLPVVVARRRLLDGVIERRRNTQAGRRQPHLQRSTRAHRTRAAAAAGETQAKCATAAWNLECATVVVMRTSDLHRPPRLPD